MRMTGVRVAAAAVAIVLAGCQIGGGAAAGLSDADRAAIQKSIVDDAQTFLASKDFTAFANGYTEDGHYLPPNTPGITGRAGIVTFLQSFPPYSDFRLGPATITGSGNTAYVQGTYSMTINPPGAAAVPEQGKYLVGVTKQADGAWKATVGIFNSDIPLPAPAPAAKK